MSIPPRRRSTIHMADMRGRPSWLYATTKRPKHYSAFLKLFCRGKNGKSKNNLEISQLLREHAAFYEQNKRHDCRESGCETAKINVTGQIYETQIKTLRRFPDTLLGNERKRRKFWDAERQEFFFDRHRPSFDAILNFYQNGGRLHRPMEVPDDVFQNEIMFFELGDDVIEYYRMEEGYLTENHPDMPPGNCERFFWLLFAHWNSSLLARCMGLWSMFVTSLSVVLVCVETLPKYQGMGCEGGVVTDRSTSEELAALFLVETTCVLWFCIELGMRFFTNPNKNNFFNNILNIVDAVTILPYAGTVVEWHYYRMCLAKNLVNTMVIFRLLKFLRIIRIFKLCRYVQGFHILLVTIRKSTSELVIFVCFVVSMVVVFASGVYYAELANKGPKFQSIPEAFWWAVVSLTTVGYGDLVPQSFSGKLVGTLCIVTGILVVALPMPVLVANFTKHYRHKTGRLLR